MNKKDASSEEASFCLEGNREINSYLADTIGKVRITLKRSPSI